ncbi:ChbG/HpnK family deacetylase [Roseixanthobacter glucoisosaccharinicivorans]|uniref:ChbG/HpnK family deacetylase n=1 Tax=Roseixanthobacter glucoisosaccharinicivorans TaxID=3119923 RepID=UPI0037278B00
MKSIWICADDYALAPGVSAAIRALLATARLNATSVMTVFPGLAEEAARLEESVQVKPAQASASIGLHVTFTGGFTPLAADPLGGAAFAPLQAVVRRALTGRLDRAAVRAEVEAQFQAFHAAFGRPPDHVDGHQHVHLLPGIRGAVLEAAARHAPGALVRDCTPAARARLGFDAKARLLGLFATGLKAQAQAQGLPTNSGFAGAYDFGPQHDFAALLAHFIAGLPDGGLVMVHPGHPDAVLASRDPVTDQRAREYAALADDGFPALLARADARLA